MSNEVVQPAGRKSVRPLVKLLPYIQRYRNLVIGAGISLVAAAVTTLTLPMAVRRMIDHGFSNSDSGFINTYFSMLMILAVILALASAARYYFVITLVSGSSRICAAMCSTILPGFPPPSSTSTSPARSSRG